MIKKTNKYFLLFTITLFLIGIVLAQVLASPKLTPLILGAAQSKDRDMEKQGLVSNDFDLFLEQDFLSIQKSLFTEKTAPQVTYQNAVQIPLGILPPQNVQVYDVKNGRLVTISWDKPDTPPAKIKILRAAVAGGKAQELGEVLGTALGYYDTDVEIGQRYYYTLVSVGEDGRESNPTGPYRAGPVQDLTPPAPPKAATFKIQADESQNQEVRIAWEDPDTLDLAFINIYRSAVPGELGQRIAQIDPGQESFIDKDICSGDTYYYLVVSQDKAGNESPYNLVESQIGNPNPFTPIF